jgi:hypothetical protein
MQSIGYADGRCDSQALAPVLPAAAGRSARATCFKRLAGQLANEIYLIRAALAYQVDPQALPAGMAELIRIAAWQKSGRERAATQLLDSTQ